MVNTKFWGIRVDSETNLAPTPFIIITFAAFRACKACTQIF
jgi:hypothetical protein